MGLVLRPGGWLLAAHDWRTRFKFSLSLFPDLIRRTLLGLYCLQALIWSEGLSRRELSLFIEFHCSFLAQVGFLRCVVQDTFPLARCIMFVPVGNAKILMSTRSPIIHPLSVQAPDTDPCCMKYPLNNFLVARSRLSRHVALLRARGSRYQTIRASPPRLSTKKDPSRVCLAYPAAL